MRFYHILKNFSIGPRIFNKYGNYATNFLNNAGVANMQKLIQWKFVKLQAFAKLSGLSVQVSKQLLRQLQRDGSLASAKSSRVILFG